MSHYDAALLVGCLVPCLYAAYTDIKSHMLYDRITLPILMGGLIAAIFTDSITMALLGAGVAFGIMWLCCALGGMGGGDLKLATGIGMWFGYPQILFLILGAALFSVPWGLLKLSRLGKLRSWARLFIAGLYLRVAFRARGVMPEAKLPEDPDAPLPPETVPFGACLALAAWITWGWQLINP